MNINEISNRTIIRILLIIAGFFCALWLVTNLQRELTWLATAFFLAVTLNPAVVWVQKHLPKHNRLAAISIVFASLGLILAGISSVLFPPLVDQSQSFIKEAPALIDNLRSGDSPLAQFATRYDLVDQIKQEQAQLFKQLSKATGSLVDVAQGIFSSLVALIIILTLSFLTLIEGPRWMQAILSSRKPVEQKRMRELADQLYLTVRSYTLGNLFRSLLITIVTLIPLLILGMPYALPLSILMGILNLIPLVGAVIGSVIVVVVCLFTSFPAAIFMAIYFAIYQQLENAVVQPLVFGRALAISAFTVTIAALVGASLAGLFGAFVAIPVAAGIRIIFRHYQKYYNQKPTTN